MNERKEERTKGRKNEEGQSEVYQVSNTCLFITENFKSK